MATMKIRPLMGNNRQITGYQVFDEDTNKVLKSFKDKKEAEEWTKKWDYYEAHPEKLKDDLEYGNLTGDDAKIAQAMFNVNIDKGKQEAAEATSKAYEKSQNLMGSGATKKQARAGQVLDDAVAQNNMAGKTKASSGEQLQKDVAETNKEIQGGQEVIKNQKDVNKEDGYSHAFLTNSFDEYNANANENNKPAADNNKQAAVNNATSNNDKTNESLELKDKPIKTEEQAAQAAQAAQNNPATATAAAVSEELKDNPNAKLNELFEAYKSGQLDMYPTLKAIVDSVAKSAAMNMDRAALLTGGQRNLDAYNPIEIEQDKIREEQISDRAKIGSSLPEAFEAAEQGDNTMLLRALDAGELTNASEEERIKTTAAIQEQIHSIDDRITQLNEVKRSLAGHDWEAFSKAGTAYRSVIEGIKTKSYSQGGSTTQGLQGNLNLGFGGFGIGGGGTDMSTGQTATGFNEDLNLSGRITDLLNKGQEAMEAQDEANSQMIVEIDQQIKSLQSEKQYWQSLMTKNRLTRLNYKS